MAPVPVELRNVSKTFGAVRALAGVSCRFEAGKVTVVRGANGSGKSTLLAIVGALARPTTGQVVHGEPRMARSEVRGTLGWVGHESLCYPDLTGRQNVELAATLHGMDGREAVERARRRFELDGFLDRPVRTTSRGQRQRIALARALVHAPQLLLLDEPTAGLDDASADRLVAVVREEAERGATVLVVTHDGGFGDSLGGSVLTLERGRLAPAARRATG